MEKINLDKYFNDNSKKYNSSCMIRIIEDMLGKSFTEIKTYVENAKIEVTGQQIMNYLDQKFTEENPELKKRIEKRKKEIKANGLRPVNLVNLTRKEIKKYARRFSDELEAQRYEYYPYTLQYFEKYSSIVRNKVKRLLTIIEALSNNNIEPIQEELKSLDILVDNNGNISKTDIYRLVIPAIANIYLLEEKLTAANDLSTYLITKMSKDLIYREGWSEDEMYPIKSLQHFGNTMFEHQDYVPLSKNQSDQIEKARRRNSKEIAKYLVNLGM